MPEMLTPMSLSKIWGKKTDEIANKSYVSLGMNIRQYRDIYLEIYKNV